jgi:hypothetical protein
MIPAVLDRRVVRPWVPVVLTLVACSVGDGTENASSFGMSTTPVTMSSSASTASATDVEDDDASGSSETATSGAGESTTTTSSATSTATSDPTSGVGTGVDTGTEQPEDGMYSACVDVTDCIGLTTCESGFCTKMCMDVSECDPAPGGTAAPACFMFGLNMLCALDCSGGETCPTPMQCTPVTNGSVCA